MITGLYSAASGMIAQTENQDVIAHNLANAGVVGFRKQRMVFRAFPDVLLQKMQPQPPQDTERGREFSLASKVGTGAGINWSFVDWSNGMLRQTGNQTDVALRGDGFFTLQTDQGLRYTRNGTFYVDADEGILRTVDGNHPVIGADGGPVFITSPAFEINRAGEVTQNGVRSGTLAVFDFVNRDLLSPEGASLLKYDGPDADVDRFTPEIVSVEQGSLEYGNADPMLEMVHLLDSFRNFETGQRAIAIFDRTLDRLINDVGTL